MNIIKLIIITLLVITLSACDSTQQFEEKIITNALKPMLYNPDTLKIDATITTILFDNEYNVLQESADIQNATLLNNENYVPRGNTALLDAIGRAVNTLKERRVNGEIEGAIVSILTDGFENASKEYTHEQIKQLIDSCEEEFGWQFVYLAANQDAFAEGSKFGIKMGNAMNFVASAAGVADATRGVTEYTSNYRAEFSINKVDNN